MQFLIILVVTICFNGIKASSFFIALAIHVIINAICKALLER